MNLLEHYIVEVVEVEELDFDRNYVFVRMVVNCYGDVRSVYKIFHKDKWKEAQIKGYYMA